jgi:transcriptional regulator with GAF, ATPase, and Fis domain
LQPLSPGYGSQTKGLTDDTSLKLDVVIGNHIKNALEKTRGKVEGKGGAAELLGVNPSTLRHRMRKLSIPFGRRTGIDIYSKSHHPKT